MQVIGTFWLISIGLLMVWGFPRLRDVFATHWILLVTVMLALLHLMVEGYRWQFIPAYIITAISCILAAIFWWKHKHHKEVARRTSFRGMAIVATRLVGVICVAMSMFFAYLFPVFQLPAPEGPFAVGTTQLELFDESRLSSNSQFPKTSRRLLVRVWYPSQTSNQRSDLLPYWSEASIQSQELGKMIGLPSFLFTHLKRVHTHSQVDAPLLESQTSYPVVIFSHGLFAGYPEQNTVLMETLASNGYVVFSINHTYWSLASVFDDGTTATSEKARAAYSIVQDEYDDPEVDVARDELSNAESKNQVRSAFDRLMALSPRQTTFFDEAMKLWSEDQRFLLDALAQINQTSQFEGGLDLANIGVVGMSFGGTATMQTCSVDDRCIAGISLDGFNINAIRIDPLTIPFLYIDTAEHIFDFETHKLVADILNDGPAYIARVDTARHFNHSDLMLFSPMFRWVGQLGTIDSDRMYSLNNTYILTFFDSYLRGGEQGITTLHEDYYPEVEFWEK